MEDADNELRMQEKSKAALQSFEERRAHLQRTVYRMEQCKEDFQDYLKIKDTHQETAVRKAKHDRQLTDLRKEHLHALQEEIIALTQERKEVEMAVQNNSVYGHYMDKVAQASKTETTWTRIQKTAEDKVILSGQIRMACLNLYRTVCGKSLHCQQCPVDPEDTDGQLKMIKTFITQWSGLIACVCEATVCTWPGAFERQARERPELEACFMMIQPPPSGSIILIDWHRSADSKEYLSRIKNKKQRRRFGLLEAPVLPPHLSVDTVRYKVLISGKSGVGKTALAARLAGLDIPRMHYDTTGIETTVLFWPVKLRDNGRVLFFRLQLWDCGENALRRFDHLLPSCKEQVDAILFLFSFTDRASFEDLSNQIARGSEPSDNVVKLVVGTKFDLFMHTDVTERDVRKFQEVWGLPVFRMGGDVVGGFGEVAPSSMPWLSACGTRTA
ncbi:hypothetical protein AAFF_G00385070 [Aldrovandia affinis]|uniref:Ciliogenesis and planar polarity effector 2 n=1 Tax=Aldrovandia affinis TaxID=143900 RepID=A0AAD7WLD1_9TELE|nr:hypothetical protein AAFF_G00385070 [Aldrovandia affinis]